MDLMVFSDAGFAEMSVDVGIGVIRFVNILCDFSMCRSV